MALKLLEDHGYGDGFLRDVAAQMLSSGQLYDAVNLLFDKPGIARQRNGTAAISALGATTTTATVPGFCYSEDMTIIEALYSYNNKNGNCYSYDLTTGAATLVFNFANTSAPGRPFRHFGFLIFPGAAPAPSVQRPSFVVAGVTGASLFGNNTNAVANIVAGNNQVTLTGTDVTTNVRAGSMIQIDDATHYYFGRCVFVNTTKIFTVWPPPTWTAAIAINHVDWRAGIAFMGGACGTSFQNRVLFGNVNQDQLQTSLADRRVWYSILPTETTTFGGREWGGASYLSPAVGPPFNYFETPSVDPIVGMESIDDGQLLVLTKTHPCLFRGDLVTQQSTTEPTVTFDVIDVPTTSNCATDGSVQRTLHGICWAGSDGIFLYSPGNREARNILQGRDATYWRDLARGPNFFIHGSAYVRDHYIVTGISNGTTFALCCNLQSREAVMSRMLNLDFFGASVVRPSLPSQVWATRWWDTVGAAPSMTNGPVQRLEGMLDNYVPGAATTDSDGSAVSFSLTSRVLTGDVQIQKFFATLGVRYEAAMAAPNITITAQSKINAADIVAQSVRAVGSLSNTEARTITAATNATPIVCTTAAHGLQTDDYVDVNGALGNTAANGRWRVTVSSSTQFSLNGSSGNGAYTASSGSMKKVTESDFPINSLDAGQGISITIASSGTVANFELHGFRIAALVRGMPPGVPQSA